jgi:outer membrane protein TolC
VALEGNIGPTFTWNIFNYGRIVNNVRLQDARFHELVAAYQSAVLTAAQEVENGLVTFLQAQDRAKFQAASVEDADKAVRIVVAQYREGTVDFTRVTQIQQNLVPLLDTLAQARGEIGLGLIQVYRALRGGWEIRLTGDETTALTAPAVPRSPEGSRLDPALKPSSAPPKPKNEKPPMSERPSISGVGFAPLRQEP